jgi:hypothetical protein
MYDIFSGKKKELILWPNDQKPEKYKHERFVKGVFSKPSGGHIVAPSFCFLS